MSVHLKATARDADVSGVDLPALCVDLDGTLVRTNTLIECFLLLLKRNPIDAFKALLSLLHGKARFKKDICRARLLKPETLPYNKDFLKYLRRQAASGRQLFLVTGADTAVAHSVADHLQLFRGVICSDGERNITGKAKAAAIAERLEGDPFVYAGNSREDLPVWDAAHAAVIVDAPAACERHLRRNGASVAEIFPRRRTSVRTLFRVMRIHHWPKNLLIFVPLMLSHRFTNARSVLASAVAFLAFSLAASVVYIFNDVSDLQTDRLHPRKKHRPFAAGETSVGFGLTLAVVLLLVVGLLCCLMPVSASLFLATYVACAFGYSIFIKRLLFADVVVLAAFYTLRILFGGAATGIQISIWTLALSMFLFLTLALSKRMTDLRSALERSTLELSGRGYTSPDLPQLASLASASGYLAVLVMALYINSAEVTLLYKRPQFLWAICPLLIYWISRVLLLANRGTMHDDPVVFALRDRVSWLVAAGIVVFGVSAI